MALRIEDQYYGTPSGNGYGLKTPVGPGDLTQLIHLNQPKAVTGPKTAKSGAPVHQVYGPPLPKEKGFISGLNDILNTAKNSVTRLSKVGSGSKKYGPPLPTSAGGPSVTPTVAPHGQARASHPSSPGVPATSSAQKAAAKVYKALAGVNNGTVDQHTRSQLALWANRYFGGYDPASLTDMMNRLQANNISLHDAVAAIKSGAITDDPLELQAGRSVSAQIDPVISQLQREISQSQSAGNTRLQQIQQLYSALSNQMQGLQSQAGQQNAQQQSAIGSGYDNLLSQINQQYNQGTQGTQNELSRLGIGAAAPAALSGLSQDQQFLTNFAGTSKQNTLGAAQNMAEGFGNLSNLLQQQAAAQGNLATNNTQAQLSQLLSGLNNEVGETESSRQGQVYLALQQLRSAAQQAQEQNAQQDFLNNIAMMNAGIDPSTGGPSQQELINEALKQAQTQSALANAYKAANPTASVTPPSYSNFKGSTDGALQWLKMVKKITPESNPQVYHLAQDLLNNQAAQFMGMPYDSITGQTAYQKAIAALLQDKRFQGLSPEDQMAFKQMYQYLLG